MTFAERMRIRPWHGIAWLSVWALLAAWAALGGSGRLTEFLTGAGTLMFAIGAFVLLCPLPKSLQRKDPGDRPRRER